MKYNCTPLERVVLTFDPDDKVREILFDLLEAFHKGTKFPLEFYASGEAGEKLSAWSFRALEEVFRSAKGNAKFKRKLFYESVEEEIDEEDAKKSKKKKKRISTRNHYPKFQQFLLHQAKYGGGVKISCSDYEEETVKPYNLIPFQFCLSVLVLLVFWVPFG